MNMKKSKIPKRRRHKAKKAFKTDGQRQSKRLEYSRQLREQLEELL